MLEAAPVGFGPQRRGDNEAPVVRAPVGFGPRNAARTPYASGIWLGGGGKDGTSAEVTGGAGRAGGIWSTEAQR